LPSNFFQSSQKPSHLNATGIQLIIAFALAVFGSAFTILLAAFHWYFLVNNLTTIEYRLKNDNPFHVGKMNNIRQIFGSPLWLWFIPIATTEETGIFFPLRTTSF